MRKLTILVNKDHPLPDDYQPSGLIPLVSLENRSFLVKYEDEEMNRTAALAADSLFRAALTDGISKFKIVSAYRSRKTQQFIYETKGDEYTALPGHSEHETGLAMDVGVSSLDDLDDIHFNWLLEHCADYGFILRYPQGKKSITGIPYEPWHYRYVGKKAAAFITKREITLEEYWQIKQSQNQTKN